jgi:Domain of unknown function (DUF4259)
MGAWGLLFDENDDAADWLGDFGDDPSWDSVDRAFGAVSIEGVYLEAPECCQALAAAEVVAAGNERPSPRLEPEIAAWARANGAGASSRRELAGRLLGKIRDASELQELWEESGEFADWQASVDETLSRL